MKDFRSILKQQNRPDVHWKADGELFEDTLDNISNRDFVKYQQTGTWNFLGNDIPVLTKQTELHESFIAAKSDLEKIKLNKNSVVGVYIKYPDVTIATNLTKENFPECLVGYKYLGYVEDEKCFSIEPLD